MFRLGPKTCLRVVLKCIVGRKQSKAEINDLAAVPWKAKAKSPVARKSTRFCTRASETAAQRLQSHYLSSECVNAIQALDGLATPQLVSEQSLSSDSPSNHFDFYVLE